MDNREDPSPRSATLPLRGPQQPEVVELGAQEVVELGLQGVVELGAQVGADSSAVVRELARVGLGTAADRDGAAGLALLFRAVRDRDPEPAGGAARVLLGRGPGLTPEGDDLLAAVAGTLAVLGPATWPHRPASDPLRPGRRAAPAPHGPTRDPLLDALAPPPGRTTALSATLLALALRRRLPEPAGRLLTFGPAAEPGLPAALARLDRLGHGSGRAYAGGIGAAAILLAAGAGVG